MMCILSRLRRALIPAVLFAIGGSAAFGDPSPTFDAKGTHSWFAPGGRLFRFLCDRPFFRWTRR